MDKPTIDAEVFKAAIRMEIELLQDAIARIDEALAELGKERKQ